MTRRSIGLLACATALVPFAWLSTREAHSSGTASVPVPVPFQPASAPVLPPGPPSPLTSSPPLATLTLEHDATTSGNFGSEPGAGLLAKLRVTGDHGSAGAWCTVLAYFYVPDMDYFTGHRADWTFLQLPPEVDPAEYFGSSFDGEPQVVVGEDFLDSMVLYTLYPAVSDRVIDWCQPVLTPTSVGGSSVFKWTTEYARWSSGSIALDYYKDLQADKQQKAILNLRNWSEALVLAQSGGTLNPSSSDFALAFEYGATIVIQVLAVRGPTVPQTGFPSFDDPMDPIPGLAGYPGQLPTWGLSNSIVIQLPGTSPATWGEVLPQMEITAETYPALRGEPIDLPVSGRYHETYARVRKPDNSIESYPLTFGGIGIGRLDTTPLPLGTSRVIGYENTFGYNPLPAHKRPFLSITE